MKSGIRNLLLASCFLFAVTYDCYTTGAEYDREYKLYSKSKVYFSVYDNNVYGERWRNLGSLTFFLGATLLITAGAVAWHRAEESANRNLSILIREE
jgi:hypothetical protein